MSGDDLQDARSQPGKGNEPVSSSLKDEEIPDGAALAAERVDDPDAVRARVSSSYGRAAVARGAESGEGAPVLPVYAGPDTAGVPASVVSSSLGCGNPLHSTELAGDEVVLDLGCGGGLDMILAARRLGPSGRVIGVDMTPEMIVLAKKNLAAAGITNAEVRQGTIESLPVAESSVDLVVSNCVLNLSPEKAIVAREIARVLRPGGRMVISDLFATEMPPDLRAHPEVWSACLAGAVPEETFLALLREAGLGEVTITSRHVLGDDELGAMLGTDGAGGCCSGGGCCGTATNVPPSTVEWLSGKVTSSIVSAGKARKS